MKISKIYLNILLGLRVKSSGAKRKRKSNKKERKREKNMKKRN